MCASFLGLTSRIQEPGFLECVERHLLLVLRDAESLEVYVEPLCWTWRDGHRSPR